jgi:hypothetical protein
LRSIVASSRPASTLFELLLVLAIIVILAALAYPSLDSLYGEYKMTAATDMVRASWAKARSHAIEEGRPYRFSVVPNKGNFRVAPDSPDYWSGEPPTPPDPANPPADLRDTLPKGIRFGSADSVRAGGLDTEGESSLPADHADWGAYSTTVVFLPDGTSRGTAREDVEISLYGRGASPVTLHLRALTGVVTVRRMQANGGRP